MHSILRWVKGFLKKNTEDHLGAYASQAALFYCALCISILYFFADSSAVFTVDL